MLRTQSVSVSNKQQRACQMPKQMQSAQSVQRRVTVTLEEDQYVGLEELAGDTGKSLAEAARDAIYHYLLGERWKDTVGAEAKRALIDGLSNGEALEAVRRKFPHARTSMASIAWYRSQLRKVANSKVPTDAEARHRRGVEA